MVDRERIARGRRRRFLRLRAKYDRLRDELNELRATFGLDCSDEFRVEAARSNLQDFDQPEFRNTTSHVRLLVVLQPGGRIVKITVPHTPSYQDFCAGLGRRLQEARYLHGGFDIFYGCLVPGGAATFPRDGSTPTTWSDGGVLTVMWPPGQ